MGAPSKGRVRHSEITYNSYEMLQWIWKKLYSVDKAYNRVQKFYFSHYGSQIDCAFAYSLGAKCPRAVPYLSSFLFSWNRKLKWSILILFAGPRDFPSFDKIFLFFSPPRGLLKIWNGWKKNWITEFHFFFVVGGGIRLPKKDYHFPETVCTKLRIFYSLAKSKTEECTSTHDCIPRAFTKAMRCVITLKSFDN